MRIYTRGGDAGKTALIGRERRWKNDSRVEAYGALDEAGAFIGLAVTYLRKEQDQDVREVLENLQQWLWDAGADLATPAKAEMTTRTKPEYTKEIEEYIDRFEETLEPLQKFVLRGGVPAAATLHVACTVMRRAERRIVALMQVETVESELLSLVNRASDLLFVLARTVNQRYKQTEVVYEHSPEVFH